MILFLCVLAYLAVLLCHGDVLIALLEEQGL